MSEDIRFKYFFGNSNCSKFWKGVLFESFISSGLRKKTKSVFRSFSRQRVSVISRRIFPRFRTSCNVILVLLHVTDIVCFYVKTVFMFQKTKNKQASKQTNKQTNLSKSLANFDKKTLESRIDYPLLEITDIFI